MKITHTKVLLEEKQIQYSVEKIDEHDKIVILTRTADFDTLKECATLFDYIASKDSKAMIPDDIKTMLQESIAKVNPEVAELKDTLKSVTSRLSEMKIRAKMLKESVESISSESDEIIEHIQKMTE